jgi:DNA-binding transcriptional ArsR family regulator
MNVYQIAAKTRTRRHGERTTSQYYPVAHKAIKALRYRGLVEIVNRDRGKKGARTVIYDLTKIGMARLIGEVEQLDFDKLARNQAGKGRDIYFDRWDFLKSKNLAKTTETMLRFQARELFLRWLLPAEYIAKSLRRVVTDDELSRFSYVSMFDDKLAEFHIRGDQDLLNRRQQEWLEAGLELARSVYVQKLIKDSRQAGKSDDEMEQDVMKLVSSLDEKGMREILKQLGVELPRAPQLEQGANDVAKTS